jgi:hypothetical protein
MDIEEFIDPESKFETCRFRSNEKIKHLVKRCSCQGGDYEVSAFLCHKRSIFDVNKEICENCTEYESK